MSGIRSTTTSVGDAKIFRNFEIVTESRNVFVVGEYHGKVRKAYHMALPYLPRFRKKSTTFDYAFNIIKLTAQLDYDGN